MKLEDLISKCKKVLKFKLIDGEAVTMDGVKSLATKATAILNDTLEYGKAVKALCRK